MFSSRFSFLFLEKEHDCDIPVRGSGNYESNEQKEIARLKRELRDAQDALDVQKSHRYSGKRLTAAIYTEVAVKAEISKVTGRRISVSGMQKI